MLSKDDFYQTTKKLLDDTFKFVSSEEGKEWDQVHNVPPEYFRYLKIYPRRRIGKTYTGFRLISDKTLNPSILVFHNELYKKDEIKKWEQKHGKISESSILTVQELLNKSFCSKLVYVKNTRFNFKLGIIDNASSVPYCHLPKLRTIMFACCKVVLELG